MTDRTCSIYALVDPRNDKIRYVGKTSKRLEQRLGEHYRDLGRRGHKANWIRSVWDEGLRVIIRLLEECPEEKWQEREIFWIKSFEGLTNQTIGGEGKTGCVVTEESRAKMSLAHKGYCPSAESRSRQSRAIMGHSVSAETRAKISRSNTGKRRSAETRAKISIDRTGRRHSEESKAKMRARRPTEETRRKLREGRKRYLSQKTSNGDHNDRG